mmetsp:Transcript_37907/g.97867  ORF Transcript_37907/g.97867 Transcript_37907/m.97867 type:complete len:164 (-) Transcript_37907:610-1101(-)
MSVRRTFEPYRAEALLFRTKGEEAKNARLFGVARQNFARAAELLHKGIEHIVDAAKKVEAKSLVIDLLKEAETMRDLEDAVAVDDRSGLGPLEASRQAVHQCVEECTLALKQYVSKTLMQSWGPEWEESLDKKPEEKKGPKDFLFWLRVLRWVNEGRLTLICS